MAFLNSLIFDLKALLGSLKQNIVFKQNQESIFN